MMEKTRTRGNVIVEDIKIGDIHYEYDYGCYCKVEVMTKPRLNKKDGCITWKSKNLLTGRMVDYGVNPRYANGAYGVKLYDYEAYLGCQQI
jgi:hypothetical protein